MDLDFDGVVFEWRGPAPYHYVRVPDDESAEIGAVASALTYGWGVVPVTVTCGDTTWTTSLFPRDGGYLVPIKDAVRRAEGIELDMAIELRLHLDG